MGIEKISDLPPTALIALGITLAVMYAIRYWGLAQGQKMLPDSGGSKGAQVAAVIVDPTALNNATAAGNNLALQISELTEEVKELHREMFIKREIDRNRHRGQGG